MKIHIGFTWALAAAVSAAFALASVAEEAASTDDVPEIGEEKPEKPEKPKKKPRKKDEYKSYVEAEAVAKAWEQPIFAFVDFGGEPLCGQVKMKLIDRNSAVKKDLIGKECVFWHCTVPEWKDKSKKNNNNRRNTNSKNRPPPKPDLNRLADEDRLAISRMTGGQVSYPLIALVDCNSGRALATMCYSDVSEATVTKLVRDFKDGMHQFGKKDWQVPPKVQKLVDREEKERERAEKHKR